MKPGELARVWEQEKPWEAPPEHPGGPKGWLRRKQREPIIRAFYIGELDQYVSVDRKGRDDVRGWILKKLGIPVQMLKDTAIDEYEAHELMAKGLGISTFHAALIDHATRGVDNDHVGEQLTGVLQRPERFVHPNLFRFAEEVEGLSTDEWDAIHNSEKNWRAIVFSTEHKERRRLTGNMFYYPQAFYDMTIAAIRKAYRTNHHRDEIGMAFLPDDIAVSIGQQAMSLEEGSRRLRSYALHT